VNARKAKLAVGAILAENGLSNKLTAETVSFQDLARADIVVVTVHDWQSHPVAQIIKGEAPQGVVVQFE
jgi:hypothetical protein